MPTLHTETALVATVTPHANGAGRPLPPPPPAVGGARRRPPAGGYGLDVIDRVRRLVVETTKPLIVIAAETGVSATTVKNWVRRYGWARPAEAPPLSSRAEFDPALRRARLAVRLYRAVGRQLSGLEQRGRAAGELDEKDARTLGTLAKTLATLSEIDGAGDSAAKGDPDAIDPDEIRARLARRLYALGQSGG